jgi:beta-glucanase (GH16 family)
VRTHRVLLIALPLLAVSTAIAGCSATTVREARIQQPARSEITRSPSVPISWGKPVFVDTFSGTTLNLSRWYIYDDPHGKYSGIRRTRSSVQVRGGSLRLIGHYERPYGYVSGGISYNINQTYGRWVVKFRADSGPGYEPIVLLWPKGTWPAHGEIDMAEVLNPDRHGAGEFLHLGRANRFIGHRIPNSVNFTKWHILAVDWFPRHITFWLDGKQRWTVKRTAGTRNYIPSTPFHLALQNDAGCDHQCAPSTSQSSRVVMQVTWIKIYAAPSRAR